MTQEYRAFINSLLEHYKPSDVQDVQKMLKDLLIDMSLFSWMLSMYEKTTAL